jgi:hypothetical protein
MLMNFHLHPLGILRKKVVESSSNSDRSRNHWDSMAPNHGSRSFLVQATRLWNELSDEPRKAKTTFSGVGWRPICLHAGFETTTLEQCYWILRHGNVNLIFKIYCKTPKLWWGGGGNKIFYTLTLIVSSLARHSCDFSSNINLGTKSAVYDAAWAFVMFALKRTKKMSTVPEISDHKMEISCKTRCRHMLIFEPGTSHSYTSGLPRIQERSCVLFCNIPVLLHEVINSTSFAPSLLRHQTTALIER